jgi:hypothetical protein
MSTEEVCVTYLKESNMMFIGIKINLLKGQSHEKVGEMRAEGDSLGPN